MSTCVKTNQQPNPGGSVTPLVRGQRPEDRTSLQAGVPSGDVIVPVCELCHQPARVHVLEGYLDGLPILRRFCLQCAHAPRLPDATRPARRRLPIAALVALVGILLGLGAILADALVPEGHAGFGWHQRGGVAAGALLVFIGILLRADLLALGGGFVFAGAICADWFGLTRNPGIGWKQQTALGVAIVCLALALLARLIVKRSARQNNQTVLAEQAGGAAMPPVPGQ